MNPRLRLWIAAIAGTVLAAVVAWNVANGSYLVAGILGAVVLWILAEWARGPLPDGWILAVLLVGYIIGNRGFAQWSLVRGIPLLPGEAALALCTPVFLLRMARKDGPGILRDGLNLAVIAWVVVGSARLPLDWRTHRFEAVRDYAMIYYAVFFFLAQALCSHAASARLLRRSALLALAILPFSYAMYIRTPEFFLNNIQLRGIPLFFYKDDLVAAFLASGFFLFLSCGSWPAMLRWTLAAISYVSIFTIDSSRAAIVGLIVGCGWWFLARRWSPLRLQAALIPAGLAALTLMAVWQSTDFRESRVYALYEHVSSITDLSGTANYQTEEREFVGDNNRFRTFWWESVIRETLESNPVFGLGYGHDLAERFIRSYNIVMAGDFSARSPHSLAVTSFGRLGLVGFLAWLGLGVAMAVRTWKLVRLLPTRDDALPVLGWWSLCWVVFTSASFGVVLEGPMGAVPFWIALGAANRATFVAEEQGAGSRGQETPD